MSTEDQMPPEERPTRRISIKLTRGPHKVVEAQVALIKEGCLFLYLDEHIVAIIPLSNLVSAIWM